MNKRFRAAINLIALAMASLLFMMAAHRRFFPPLLKTGDTLPPLQLRLTQGGDTAADHSRRAFILYRGTCSHCQRTIASLMDVYHSHPDWFSASGIAVDLVDVAENDQALPGQSTMPFSFYAGHQKRIMQDLKGSLVPYVIFVDKDNTVRYSHAGELTFEQEQKLFQEFHDTGHIL